MTPECRKEIDEFYADREKLMRDYVMFPAIVIAEAERHTKTLLAEIDSLEIAYEVARGLVVGSTAKIDRLEYDFKSANYLIRQLTAQKIALQAQIDTLLERSEKAEAELAEIKSETVFYSIRESGSEIGCAVIKSDGSYISMRGYEHLDLVPIGQQRGSDG